MNDKEKSDKIIELLTKKSLLSNGLTFIAEEYTHFGELTWGLHIRNLSNRKGNSNNIKIRGSKLYLCPPEHKYVYEEDVVNIENDDFPNRGYILLLLRRKYPGFFEHLKDRVKLNG